MQNLSGFPKSPEVDIVSWPGARLWSESARYEALVQIKQLLQARNQASIMKLDGIAKHAICHGCTDIIRVNY